MTKFLFFFILFLLILIVINSFPEPQPTTPPTLPKTCQEEKSNLISLPPYTPPRGLAPNIKESEILKGFPSPQFSHRKPPLVPPGGGLSEKINQEEKPNLVVVPPYKVRELAANINQEKKSNLIPIPLPPYTPPPRGLAPNIKESEILKGFPSPQFSHRMPPLVPPGGGLSEKINQEEKPNLVVVPPYKVRELSEKISQEEKPNLVVVPPYKVRELSEKISQEEKPNLVVVPPYKVRELSANINQEEKPNLVVVPPYKVRELAANINQEKKVNSIISPPIQTKHSAVVSPDPPCIYESSIQRNLERAERLMEIRSKLRNLSS